jgi:hypothetical protein
MPILDLFDQIQVTEFVRRELRGDHPWRGRRRGPHDALGRGILPMRARTTAATSGSATRTSWASAWRRSSRRARLRSCGPTSRTSRERFMELVDIDEAHPVDPVEMLAIKSNDPNRRDEAQFDLAEKATAMATRNDQRTMGCAGRR